MKKTIILLIFFVCALFLSSCTMTGQPIRNTYDTIPSSPGSNLGGNADSSDLSRLTDLDEEDIRTTVTCSVGDLDCDGVIDFSDINHYVNALIDQEEFLEDCQNQETDCWKPEFGGCANAMLNADISENGAIGFEDINIFVDLLLGVNPECSDGIDNDCDLYEDHPADLGCYSPEDVSEESTCNNNHIEDGEACDGSDLGGQGCQTLGFQGGGVLQCNPNCLNFDTSNCLECTNNNHCPPDDVCQNNVCVFPQTGDTICGDGTAEGWEECDGTDGLISCNAFNPAYTGGQLGCFGVDDTYGRGCSYDFSNCQCDELFVDFRVFPIDGSAGDFDGMQDGIGTVRVNEEYVLDASMICKPSPGGDYYVWNAGCPSEPICTRSTANPSLLDVQLDYYYEMSAVEVIKEQALRIYTRVTPEDTSPDAYAVLPQSYVIIDDKVYFVGQAGLPAVEHHWEWYVFGWTYLSEPYPVKTIERSGLAVNPANDNCGSDVAFNRIATNSDEIFVLGYNNIVDESFVQIHRASDHQLLSEISLGVDYAYGLAASGDAVYVGYGSSRTMEIYDVSNPSNPVKRLDTGIYGGISGLYTYEEILFVGRGNEIRLYDISNVFNPIHLNTIPGQFADKYGRSSIVYQGVIVLFDPVGFKLMDISNPSNPIEIGIINFQGANLYNRKIAMYGDYLAFAKGSKLHVTTEQAAKVFLYKKNPSGVYEELQTFGETSTQFCDRNDLYESDDNFRSVFIAEDNGKTYLYAGSAILSGYKRFEIEPDYE